MRNKKRLRYIILGIYVLAMVTKVLLNGRFYVWDLVGMVVGAIVGFEMNWFDRVAYIYITRPEVQLSLQVQYWVKNKELKRAFEAVRDRVSEMDRLTTRSILFQVAWVGLAFFAITSTGGGFSRMLVMGLGLEMLVSQWMAYGQDKMQLKQELFWQIKREVSNLELKRYLWVMSGVFVVLSLMVG